MKFTPPFSPEFESLIREKAQKPELLRGFEIDEITLAKHSNKRNHPRKTPAMRDALNLYAALFDPEAPHSVFSSDLEILDPEHAQLVRCINHITREERITRQAIVGAIEESAAKAIGRDAADRGEARYSLIRTILLALILLALLATRAHAQATGGILIQGANGGSTLFNRSTGLLVLKCDSTTVTCTWTAATNTLTISSAGSTFTLANDGVTGTTQNLLAKITSSGTAMITATTDTSAAIGIVTGGAGTTGSATIATGGIANCIFDGATTAGDAVAVSSTIAGNCHDVGAPAYPSTKTTIGRVLSTNVGAGTYAVLIQKTF